MNINQPVIRFEHYSLSLKENLLVETFNAELTKGTLTFIVGKNGVGKSSVLKSLKGLLPYKGKVLFTSPPAYLPQQNNLNFDLPIKDIILSGTSFQKKAIFEKYSTKDQDYSTQIIKRLGLEHICHQSYLSLSGGEQQLVWIAFLLAQDADILLIDEPLQNLDLANCKKIYQLLNDLSKEGKTILCVTHQILELSLIHFDNAQLMAIQNKKIAIEKLNEQIIQKLINNIF